MKIKDARPIKIGNSHYFNIPKPFIDNEVIDPNKRYNLEISDNGVDLSLETVQEKTQAAIEQKTKEASQGGAQ